MIPNNPKSILVIKLDHIGDVLWATPALATIRQNCPSAKITVLCTRYTEPALRNNPNVDRIIACDDNIKRALADCKKLFGVEVPIPDVTICMDPRPDAIALAGATKAAVRAGCYYPDKPMSVINSMTCLTDRLYHPAKTKENREKPPHDVLVNLDMLTMIGIGDNPIMETKIYLTDDEKALAENVLSEHGLLDKRIIMYHLPLKWLDGEWNAEYVAKLANLLIERNPGFRLLVTCGPKEESLMDSIRPTLPSGSVCLAGMDFRIWSGLVGHCKLLVSRDCGAVHVAAAMQTPVISVFEASKWPEHLRWEPWGVEHVNINRPETWDSEKESRHLQEMLDAAESLLVSAAAK